MDDDSFDEEPVIQTETLGIPMQVWSYTRIF